MIRGIDEQPSSSMKIKSYFASSVEQAIQEARQELGTDAMLITSRRSSPETRSLGAYEVVFGLKAPTARNPTQRPGCRFIRRAAKLARAAAGNQEHVARRAAARSCRRRKPKSSSKNGSNDLARNIAQEMVSTAVRLREQLSRDQPAPPLALRAYAAELISKKLRFAGHSRAASQQSSSDAARWWSSPDPPARAKPPR